jgi:hypothetical protein
MPFCLIDISFECKCYIILFRKLYPLRRPWCIRWSSWVSCWIVIINMINQFSSLYFLVFATARSGRVNLIVVSGNLFHFSLSRSAKQRKLSIDCAHDSSSETLTLSFKEIKTTSSLIISRIKLNIQNYINGCWEQVKILYLLRSSYLWQARNSVNLDDHGPAQRYLKRATVRLRHRSWYNKLLHWEPEWKNVNQG